MASFYSEIMDSNVNSLKRLPVAQRFQIMVYLSMMWTVIFCVGTGAWFWYGHLVVAHVAVALGAAITSWTFFNARSQSDQSVQVRIESKPGKGS